MTPSCRSAGGGGRGRRRSAVVAGSSEREMASIAFHVVVVLVAEREQRHAAEAGVDRALHPDLRALAVDVVDLPGLRARRGAVGDVEVVRERHLHVTGHELRRRAPPRPRGRPCPASTG